MINLLITALISSAAAPMPAASALIAEGSNRAFHYEVTTTAPASAVWAIWTDVAGWGRWDRGLKSASLTGPFVAGARGTIVPLSGPPSRFDIKEVREGISYRFTTALPLASLSVTRTIVSIGSQSPTVFRHDVRFDGLLGGFWASRFGPGFRKALPPTMTAIAALAEGNTP